jgi:hypothetical protein
MKFLVMALMVAIFGMIWAMVINCPAFALFMLPCMAFAGILLYIEVKGGFNE